MTFNNNKISSIAVAFINILKILYRGVGISSEYYSQNMKNTD